jgi:stage III sporulation protein AA
MEHELLKNEILPYIHLDRINEIILPGNINQIDEIRIREGRPIIFYGSKTELFLGESGRITDKNISLYKVSKEEIYKILLMISQKSLYAYKEDIINGFITLPGGHRVGIVGKTIIEHKRIKNIINYSGLNFRISHFIYGCAEKIFEYLIEDGQVLNTLIISPPACGKTTILRDVARIISNGTKKYNFQGIKVGIVDERSEIASLHNGLSRYDIGLRTDVLDGCPKQEGIMMMLRTMSPEVIITDEIGGDSDLEIIDKTINAGVKIITSFHGYGISKKNIRTEVTNILNKKLFERIIILSKKEGPGTLEEVFDCVNKVSLLRR